jgi:hypothetical protein
MVRFSCACGKQIGYLRELIEDALREAWDREETGFRLALDALKSKLRDVEIECETSLPDTREMIYEADRTFKETRDFDKAANILTKRTTFDDLLKSCQTK